MGEVGSRGSSSILRGSPVVLGLFLAALDNTSWERVLREKLGHLSVRCAGRAGNEIVCDPIRVALHRGAIELKARADSAVPSGVVLIPFCYTEAAANIPRNPQFDPLGESPNSNSARRGSKR